jgi:hypothetical protein
MANQYLGGTVYHEQVQGDQIGDKRKQPNWALELIRQKAPQILLGTISNIYERRIIDYIICFAIYPSNPRKLWETIRNVTIDQFEIGVTKAQIDNESDMLFNLVAKHYFPELTDPQINELYRSFEQAIVKRIW